MTPQSSTPFPAIHLKPGSLWPRVLTQTQTALAGGALQSITTTSQLIQCDHIPFIIRISSQLQAKAQLTVTRPTPCNPFLPYDPNLFVTAISDRHICLLNKFNVTPHHLLLVTRDFVPQEEWLNRDDFLALWACWQDLEALAFYNSGQPAGASQRHKHLQLMPLPLTPAGVPIATLWPTAQWQDGIGTIPSLPFQHAIAAITPADLTDAHTAATRLEQLYHALLRAVGITQPAPDFTARPAYNWLATRQWMLLVPRSQDSYQTIPVNALGFAGTFFVRDQPQLDRLLELGPLTVLQGVGYSR